VSSPLEKLRAKNKHITANDRARFSGSATQKTLNRF
jgi:hypothetical protein